jgi:hypothetical protein
MPSHGREFSAHQITKGINSDCDYDSRRNVSATPNAPQPSPSCCADKAKHETSKHQLQPPAATSKHSCEATKPPWTGPPAKISLLKWHPSSPTQRSSFQSATPMKSGTGLSRTQFVRFRLCMSMEWMNECVDRLFITQLLKA